MGVIFIFLVLLLGIGFAAFLEGEHMKLGNVSYVSDCYDELVPEDIIIKFEEDNKSVDTDKT